MILVGSDGTHTKKKGEAMLNKTGTLAGVVSLILGSLPLMSPRPMPQATPEPESNLMILCLNATANNKATLTLGKKFTLILEEGNGHKFPLVFERLGSRRYVALFEYDEKAGSFMVPNGSLMFESLEVIYESEDGIRTSIAMPSVEDGSLLVVAVFAPKVAAIKGRPTTYKKLQKKIDELYLPKP